MGVAVMGLKSKVEKLEILSQRLPNFINREECTPENRQGIAAFWLQSVYQELEGASWVELCARVSDKFTKDRQEALLRQMICTKQTSAVTAYVEKFDVVMH
ncbi:uncharacterized protein LOC107303438 [Oryza brachyantha]|uniref:uncharacterized protein LOC107303438 n=1 Tax=Oryza brachyantha TaxID=4533 RepID=UPI0007762495|nr:uncharacterized protein LOC107303438 [Oryza brachyantha]